MRANPNSNNVQASGNIHGALRDLKKEAGELEAECTRVAKMPSNEEQKRLEV